MSNVADSASSVAEKSQLAASSTALPTPDRVRVGFLISAIFLQLSVAVPSVGLVLVAWPLVVAELEPVHKVTYLSIITGMLAAFGIVLTPLVGALSDRCRAKMGMRKPFIIVGSLISVAGLVSMGLASSIGTLLAGAALYSLGNAALTSITWTLIPDQIPPHFRSRAQGYMMATVAVSGLVASIYFPTLIGDQLMLFGVPAAIKVVAVVLVLFLLKDRVLAPEDSPGAFRIGAFFRAFVFDPRKVPDYTWVWVAKVVFTVGTVLTSTYGVYLLTDKIGVTTEQLTSILQINGVIGLGTALGGALVGGWLSDRLGRRKIFVFLSSVLVALGAAVVALAPDATVFIIGSTIVGLGAGLYAPVDGALAMDVLPGEGRQSGKYMSIMAVGDQLPRALGPVLGSVVIALAGLVALSGYTLVYLIGGSFALVAAFMIYMVKGSR